MGIIKRDRNQTKKDLITATKDFIELLTSQGEDEAIADLTAAVAKLETAQEKTDEFYLAISAIIDAFEGDHELEAYTLQREGDQWTEVEALSQSSARVLSLARRLKAKAS